MSDGAPCPVRDGGLSEAAFGREVRGNLGRDLDVAHAAEAGDHEGAALLVNIEAERMPRQVLAPVLLEAGGWCRYGT